MVFRLPKIFLILSQIFLFQNNLLRLFRKTPKIAREERSLNLFVRSSGKRNPSTSKSAVSTFVEPSLDELTHKFLTRMLSDTRQDKIYLGFGTILSSSKFITALLVISFIFLFSPLVSEAQAASRYWVTGGTGNWSSTTNWAATSGGSSGASVPTSSDAVIFDASSGSGTATIDTTSSAGSLDMTSFTGTLAGSSTLTIANNTVGGNVTFGASMTVTWTGQLAIQNSSGTVIVTTNGKTIPGSLNINKAGGTTQLADNFTWSDTVSLQVQAGTFNTNNRTLYGGELYATGGTLTMGSSSITLTKTSAYIVLSGGSTVTANTATITITGSGGQPNPGNVNWNGASLVFSPTSSSAVTLSGSPTFANITFNNTANQTTSYSFAAGTTWTATGTITSTGNSISNRIKIGSATRGTSFTMSAATWTLSNTDFEDMVGAGAGTFSTSATVGNLGGNSGTFAGRTPATYYWVSGTGSYSNTAKWSLTSGGSSASTIPLPQDTARFDANSFTAGSQTVTFDTLSVGSIDFTGATNTPTLSTSISFITYGSMTLISGMNWASTGGLNGSNVSFYGRGTTSLTSAGKTFNTFTGFAIDTITGTFNMNDDVSGIVAIGINSGTFNTNNRNITLVANQVIFQARGVLPIVTTLNLGTSLITINTQCNNQPVPFSFQTSTQSGLTVNATQTTFNLINTGSSACGIRGNGYNLGTFNISGAGTSAFTISGSNTFKSLKSTGAARTIIFTAGTTQTITTKNGFITGGAGNVQTLQSSSSGTAWNLTCSTGCIESSDYLSIQDSNASERATWFAGNHSTNVSGNVNWIFTAPGYSVNSPKAYWKFDEGQGTTVNDTTDGANTGTLSGSTIPTWQSEDLCKSGKCLYYNGSSSYVTVSNSSSLQITSNLSLGAWVRLSNVSSVHDIISKKGALGSFGYRLYTDASGKLNLEVSSDGTATTLATGSTTLTANQWYYLEGVYTTSTSLTVYVNGIQDGQNVSSIPSSINNTSTVVNIGAENAGGSNFMSGYIDSVKIFSNSRTSAQILADYNSLAGREVISQQLGSNTQNLSGNLSNGLVGYWKMDEASWTNDCLTASVLDSSGNGNNGKACPATTGPTGGAAGKFGNGGSFDGTDDYILTSSTTVNPSATDFTASIWFKPSNVSSTQTLIAEQDGSGTGRDWLYITSGSKLSSFIGGADTLGTTTLVTGNWYHAVVTKAGTTVTVYLNGAKETSTTETAESATGVNVIGASKNLNSERLNGTIDEARVYNRALSGNEVTQLYNWAPGPVGYWKFDDKTGTAAVDSSGNANSLTLTNMATAPSTATSGWINAKYGGGLIFDGSDDTAVTSGDVDALDIRSGSMSHGFWFKTTTASRQIFYRKSDASNANGILMEIGNGTAGQLRCIYNLTGQVVLTSGVSTYNDGNWHYFECVLDRSIPTAYLYVDGNLSTSASASGLAGIDMNAVGAANFGGSSGGFAAGAIDDFKIYNYARTQGQVIQDMNAGHPAPGSPVGTPLGYWKFDEGYGTTANNSGSQGSTLNGTLTNMASPATSTSGWTTNGKFGKALNFDGTDDYVDAGDINSLDAATQLTYSAWVRPTSLRDFDGVISKSSSSISRSAMSLGGPGIGGNDDVLVMVGDGSNTYAYTNSNIISTGVWHHWVMVYNGTGTSNTDKLKFYLDGIEQTLTFSGTIPSATANNSATVKIGQELATRNFNGSIDEVKIYNSALTADQIKLDMNRGQALVMGSSGDNSTYSAGSQNQEYCVPGDSTSCAPPVGRWDFEEGSGTSAKDTSGNENTGTLTNGPTYTKGHSGKGINFDGINDYATTGVNNIPAVNGNITVSAWFKYSSVPSTVQDIIAIQSSSPNGALQVGFRGSGNIDVWKVGATSFGSATAPSANNWHHVEFTYDGTNNKLYVDGVLKSTNTTSHDTGTTTSVRIGGNTGGEPFAGQIDQVQIFNYARTAAQVAYDYNRGGPVGWWKMDECQGTTINDSSGNSNTGTLTVGATGTYTSTGNCGVSSASTSWYNGAAGKRNYSLAFDGTDDYVDLGRLTSYTESVSQMSWSVWMKASSISNLRCLVCKYNSNDTQTGFGLELNTLTGGLNNSIIGGIPTSTTDGNTYFISPANSISSGTWYHVLMVFDGTQTGNANRLKLYINGVQQTLTFNGTFPATTSAATSNVRIGALSDGARYFPGQLDDVRVYNYALTATQVKTLYNDGAARYGPVTGAP